MSASQAYVVINHARLRLMSESTCSRYNDISHGRAHRNEGNPGKTLHVTQTRSAHISHYLRGICQL